MFVVVSADSAAAAVRPGPAAAFPAAAAAAAAAGRLPPEPAAAAAAAATDGPAAGTVPADTCPVLPVRPVLPAVPEPTTIPATTIPGPADGALPHAGGGVPEEAGGRYDADRHVSWTVAGAAELPTASSHDLQPIRRRRKWVYPTSLY